MSPIPPVVDRSLSRRLELAEGRTSVAYVESRARLAPEVGAAWAEAGGAVALFDGVGSPITQTFGFGIAGPASADDLARLDAFLDERGAPPFHEVSPLADPAHLALLADRGYRPVELTTVLYQPIARDARADEPADVPRARPIAPGEARLWSDTAAAGWGTEGEWVADFMRAFGEVSAAAEGVVSFVAELDGEPVGAATLSIRDGVALLSGASTRPECAMTPDDDTMKSA